jgi:hypothetical protein
MKLTEIFTRLLRRLSAQPAQIDGLTHPAQSQEMLKNLLRKIEMTQEVELSCDETL